MEFQHELIIPDEDFLSSFFSLKEETEIMSGKTLAYFDRDFYCNGRKSFLLYR